MSNETEKENETEEFELVPEDEEEVLEDDDDTDEPA